MAMFAEGYLLQIQLPYSEYWLPLAIGIGVGLLAITASKLTFLRRAHAAPVRPAKAQEEYDPFTLGSPTEQRKSFRRTGNPTMVYLAQPDCKDQPKQGWVLDRSMGGLCILVDDEVEAGTSLAVIPVNAPPMTPWVDIEVRSCRASHDGFELGCQFVRTPAWSILLMFG
jgi:hypothetical protein